MLCPNLVVIAVIKETGGDPFSNFIFVNFGNIPEKIPGPIFWNTL